MKLQYIDNIIIHKLKEINRKGQIEAGHFPSHSGVIQIISGAKGSLIFFQPMPFNRKNRQVHEFLA